MSYSPGVRTGVIDPFVSPFSRHGYAMTARMVGVPASAAYPAVQRAYYFPVIIPVACTIYRFFWQNGATASTDNIQVGIYNDNDAGTDGPGTAFLRGTSTLASGANVCQFDNVTDTGSLSREILAGDLGFGCTTTTLHRSAPSAVFARATNGYLESSLASGLPTTATPAQNTTPYVPVFGFTTRSSP